MASFTGAKGSICLARGRQYLPVFQRDWVLKTANICNLQSPSHIEGGQGDLIDWLSLATRMLLYWRDRFNHYRAAILQADGNAPTNAIADG
jgi:hypothetical protein